LNTAYLSLGSNLGEREDYLRTALSLLEKEQVTVSHVSSVYETEPMELSDQPWFLNIVAEVRTALEPIELLGRCQKIEARLGRRRTIAKGPRTIDIDILLYAERTIATARLRVPHPAMADRRFVLEPLAELAPSIKLPDTDQTIGELLAALQGQAVRRIGPLRERAASRKPPS